MSDTLIKLLFPAKSCRAEVLHLDDAWQSMIKNQHLPVSVKHMLGEMTAGAVMLAASLKFDGALILQLQGDGPVKLALVEVRSGLVTRATAQLRVAADTLPDTMTFKEMVNVNGHGRCAMILDMAGRAVGEQPYQGVIPLTEDSVAQTIEAYMTQSEQIPTRLWLCATEQAVGGVLLQQVASTGGKESAVEVDPEGMKTLELYANTVKPEELLGLDAKDLAMRLFWEDNPQILEELVPTFGCRCSLGAIEAMVKSLGKEEAESIVAESGKIEVTCEFCGSTYALDGVDIQRLFADPAFSAATTDAAH